MKFSSGIVPPPKQPEPSWWFVFRESKILVIERSGSLEIPLLINFQELGLAPLRQNYFGELDHRSCYAVEVTPEAAPPEGMSFEGLRQVYGRLDEDLFWVTTRGVQIVDWDRTHLFCSRCAALLQTSQTERAKKCLQCGLLHFPRLSPAIIVLIQRENEVLLARSRHFLPGMYSVIAGFVEPGESLEEAVVREVKEEVGISIGDIRYFCSQPWPFPHSLMIGYTATYDGGEITLNDSEIEDAGWFSAGNLPRIPSKISIARKLIDSFLAKQGKVDED